MGGFWNASSEDFPRVGYLNYRLVAGGLGMFLNGLVIAISAQPSIQGASYRAFVLFNAWANLASDGVKIVWRLLFFAVRDFGPAEAPLCHAMSASLRYFAGLTTLAIHPLLLQRFVAVCRTEGSRTQRWGFGLKSRATKGLSMAVVCILSLLLGAPPLLQSLEGRIYGGMECTYWKNGSEDSLRVAAKNVVGRAGLGLQLAHFLLLFFYSARIHRVVMTKANLLPKNVRSAEAARIRETRYVLWAGVVQAVAPILLFLPLLVSLVWLRKIYPDSFYYALELLQLGPIYEGAAALLILKPYRRFLAGRLLAKADVTPAQTSMYPSHGGHGHGLPALKGTK